MVKAKRMKSEYKPPSTSTLASRARSLGIELAKLCHLEGGTSYEFDRYIRDRAVREVLTPKLREAFDHLADIQWRGALASGWEEKWVELNKLDEAWASEKVKFEGLGR